MSVELVPEQDLYEALRPCRAEAGAFEAGVHARIEADQQTQEQAPILRVAAAFLPWPLIVEGNLVGSGVKLSSLALGQKLLGFMALPAISLFCLVGAAFFSTVKIRSLQKDNHPDIDNAEEMHAAVRQWWDRYKWAAWLVFAVVLMVPMFGRTWPLFLLLLVSFGALLVLLSSLAKFGVGNQAIIGRSCFLGLMFLGQAMLMSGVGRHDIHFVDQTLIGIVFYVGTLILLSFLVKMKRPGIYEPTTGGARGFYVFIMVPMLVFFTNPIWWPTTPARIQHHVESFKEGNGSFIDWQDWEIAASWAIEAGLDPDLSRARKLLGGKIAKDPQLLSLILGSAFRVGVVRTDQIEGLAESERLILHDSYAGLEKIRRSLLPETRLPQPRRFTSLALRGWAIYALDQSDQLSSEDRDFLEQRLLATLDALLDGEAGTALETTLRATQLLEVIDRPVDRDQYRERVHGWLQELHCKKPSLHQIAGGFGEFKARSSSSLEATSHAVELMEIYGIPDGLDLNWVRSYLRPLSFRPRGKWVAAVTLNRLNDLPGATQPTWLEMLYYERSLIAAMVLVMLCIYATYSSPGAHVSGSPSYRTGSTPKPVSRNS